MDAAHYTFVSLEILLPRWSDIIQTLFDLEFSLEKIRDKTLY